jgi:hypothetical protein
MKNVLIMMSSNPKVHHTIDIIVVDIPDTYGMLLSRDWSAMLKGYFSIDWSHYGYLTMESLIKSELIEKYT